MNAITEPLELSDVKSVYRSRKGQTHACCCGCKGTHRYPSQHAAEQSKVHGYAVTVNDNYVKAVVNVINANLAKAEMYVAAGICDYVSLELNDILFIAYLTT